jgi:vitamin B12 transporter
VDGNRSFSIQRLNTDPYFVVNLAAEYNVNKNVNLFARIDNLLDRRYESPTGFQRPGFGVFGGVQLSWGPSPTPAQSTEDNKSSIAGADKETSK